MHHTDVNATTAKPTTSATRKRKGILLIRLIAVARSWFRTRRFAACSALNRSSHFYGPSMIFARSKSPQNLRTHVSPYIHKTRDQTLPFFTSRYKLRVRWNQSVRLDQSCVHLSPRDHAPSPQILQAQRAESGDERGAVDWSGERVAPVALSAYGRTKYH